MGFADRLRQALELRGRQKRYALAAEIGVNASSVTRWLQGGPISMEHMVRLCDVLEISLDWLLLGRGSFELAVGEPLTPTEERLLALSRAMQEGTLEHLINLLQALGKTEPVES